MRFALFAAAVLMIAPAAANAHPRLLSATPAADAVAAPTATVSLSFSENLVAQFSSAEVVMTDMPGMKMKTPMKMPGKAALAADGKTLVVTFPRTLPRGTYTLSYHVVSTDTHRVEGSYGFRIH